MPMKIAPEGDEPVYIRTDARLHESRPISSTMLTNINALAGVLSTFL